MSRYQQDSYGHSDRNPYSASSSSIGRQTSRRAGGYGGFYEEPRTNGVSAYPDYQARGQQPELEPTGGNWSRRSDRNDREWSNTARERGRAGGPAGRRYTEGQGTLQ